MFAVFCMIVCFGSMSDCLPMQRPQGHIEQRARVEDFENSYPEIKSKQGLRDSENGKRMIMRETNELIVGNQNNMTGGKQTDVDKKKKKRWKLRSRRLILLSGKSAQKQAMKTVAKKNYKDPAIFNVLVATNVSEMSTGLAAGKEIASVEEGEVELKSKRMDEKVESRVGNVKQNSDEEHSKSCEEESSASEIQASKTGEVGVEKEIKSKNCSTKITDMKASKVVDLGSTKFDIDQTETSDFEAKIKRNIEKETGKGVTEVNFKTRRNMEKKSQKKLNQGVRKKALNKERRKSLADKTGRRKTKTGIKDERLVRKSLEGSANKEQKRDQRKVEKGDRLNKAASQSERLKIKVTQELDRRNQRSKYLNDQAGDFNLNDEDDKQLLREYLEKMRKFSYDDDDDDEEEFRHRRGYYGPDLTDHHHHKRSRDLDFNHRLRRHLTGRYLDDVEDDDEEDDVILQRDINNRRYYNRLMRQLGYNAYGRRHDDDDELDDFRNRKARKIYLRVNQMLGSNQKPQFGKYLSTGKEEKRSLKRKKKAASEEKKFRDKTTTSKRRLVRCPRREDGTCIRKREWSAREQRVLRNLKDALKKRYASRSRRVPELEGKKLDKFKLILQDLIKSDEKE